MEAIIDKIVAKFKREAKEFLGKDRKDIEAAEEFFVPRLSEMVTELMSGLYEEADEALLADRAGRRESGLTVERRGDRRRVLTLLGEVGYKRTYYQMRDGTYCYPIDELAGVEAYERISNGVSEALVSTARKVSYVKSSQFITDGAVSKQTVMNKIRRSVPKIEVVERQRVPVLHIDADEDHVNLYGGGSTSAPLIAVYTGIERQGKRGKCKDVFHISEYGKSADELWEIVLTELERRYDLQGTKIYLHGDGAQWIKVGLNWLPNSVLVLDRYHVNKALKAAVSGIETRTGSQYEHLLRNALQEGDREFFLSVRDSLLAHWPDRKASIWENTDYLLAHFEAIHIWHVDSEARSGGATEPHVSNILSARLSSRPMAWSRNTLRRLLPILAAGSSMLEYERDEESALSQPEAQENPVVHRKAGRRFGLPDPDLAVHIPGTSGKVTPLFNALRPFVYS